MSVRYVLFLHSEAGHPLTLNPDGTIFASNWSWHYKLHEDVLGFMWATLCANWQGFKLTRTPYHQESCDLEWWVACCEDFVVRSEGAHRDLPGMCPQIWQPQAEVLWKAEVQKCWGTFWCLVWSCQIWGPIRGEHLNNMPIWGGVYLWEFPFVFLLLLLSFSFSFPLLSSLEKGITNMLASQYYM